ncbi:MAG: TolC family protein, partial [Thiovulaceae bacterium]|nr:TolC family protein [Sulfurimonadaceae bacterium]
MKLPLSFFLLTLTLFATTQEKVISKNLTLSDALNKVKSSNLELAIAKYEIDLKNKAKWSAHAMRLGTLDLTQNIMRSNDAGNVFGFKLSAREASFNDFGFAEYTGDGTVEPVDLNYPGIRDYYQTKLTYKLPIFVGGKLFAGANISSAMHDIAKLQGKELELQKIYQVKKSFYDIALLEGFLDNLKKVKKNVTTIETMTKTMVTEGYARKVDLLEVKSKKASISRLISQSEANHKLALHFLSFLLNEPVSAIDTKSIKDVTKKAAKYQIEELLMVKKAQKGLSIANSMVWIARADYLPTIGAFAEISSADDTFGGDFEDHKSFTVGV